MWKVGMILDSQWKDLGFLWNPLKFSFFKYGDVASGWNCHFFWLTSLKNPEKELDLLHHHIHVFLEQRGQTFLIDTLMVETFLSRNLSDKANSIFFPKNLILASGVRTTSLNRFYLLVYTPCYYTRFRTSVLKSVLHARRTFLPRENRLIHTKLDFKINFAFMCTA